MRTRTTLVGAAGEYHVAAEMSRRGWLATVTIKNAPGTDVLAKHVETGVTVSIQTKTSSGGDKFTVGAKDEQPAQSPAEWFVFVRLNELVERPSFYVVPRDVVAGCIYASHREWLAAPGRGGRDRKDNPMRNVYVKWIAKYQEQWDLLHQPSTEALALIDPSWIESARRHGISAFIPTHPWS